MRFTGTWISANYTVGMTDLSAINLQTSSVINSLLENNSTLQVQNETDSFQQLLSYMLLSGMGSSSGSSGDFGDLLSPLMMLLEQLQMQQLVTGSGSVDMLQSGGEQGIGNCPWPVEGPLTWDYLPPTHNGMDFGINVGTPIQTSITGKVVFAGWDNTGYGNLVIVDNGTYQTYYAHLSEITVTKNDVIRQGEMVGYSGNTGNSTGPHLHYEVRKNDKVVNPEILHGPL